MLRRRPVRNEARNGLAPPGDNDFFASLGPGRQGRKFRPGLMNNDAIHAIPPRSGLLANYVAGYSGSPNASTEASRGRRGQPASACRVSSGPGSFRPDALGVASPFTDMQGVSGNLGRHNDARLQKSMRCRVWPAGRSAPTSAQRVDQLRFDDSPVPCQKCRAEHAGRRHQNAIGRVAMKGIRQRRQLRRYRRRDAVPSHQRRGNGLFQPLPQGIVRRIRPRLCSIATSQSEISETSSGESAPAAAMTSFCARDSRSRSPCHQSRMCVSSNAFIASDCPNAPPRAPVL